MAWVNRLTDGIELSDEVVRGSENGRRRTRSLRYGGGESLYVEAGQRQTVGSCLMTRLAVVSQVHGRGRLASSGLG